MPIAFEAIPPNQLVPFFYAEVTTFAQPISPSLRVLLLGYANSEVDEGTADAHVPYILSDTNVTSLFGPGSQLEGMYRFCRMNAPYTEIWGASLRQGESAGRSWAEIRVINDATRGRSGNMSFWVSDKRVDIQVRYNDTREVIRNRLYSTINNAKELPFYATKKHPETGDIDTSGLRLFLQAKFKGGAGNSLELQFYNARGTRPALARRLIEFRSNFHDGSGSGGFDEIIQKIGDMDFDLFVTTETGQGNMDTLSAFMDHTSGRWAPNKQLYGHVVTAKKSSWEQLIQFADLRNDPHISVMGFQSQQLEWEWAAALAGVISVHWIAPPELSRPLQTLALSGCYASWQDDEIFNANQRQSLLDRGISTFKLDNDGTVRIERIRTLRKFSPVGELDPSWADAITLFQAQYFVRFLRRAVSAAFPRAALTTDPTTIPGFASPSQIREVILSAYADLESVGLVENTALFADALIVERNSVDRNRVDCYVTPDMVNQLRVVAVLVETHLELIDDGQIAA